MTKQAIDPEEVHQRQLRNRLGLIGLLVAVIVVLLATNLYQQQVLHWTNMDSNLGIFFLINLNVILLLLTVLLVLRNLIKLIYEVRQRRLGFRLKFKLTLAFVLVSALPMVMFFFIANGFLRSSMDFWFQAQFNQTIGHSEQLIQSLLDQQDQLLRQQIQTAAQEMALSGQPKRHLTRLANQHPLWVACLYDAELKPLETAFGSPEAKQLWWPFGGKLPPLAQLQEPLMLQNTSKGYQVKRMLLPLQGLKLARYLELAQVTPPEATQLLRETRTNLNDQKNLIGLENPIRANFTTYLLAFSLLIIFAGIWFSYYLARSIVEPLEILVDGTERISRGDLDFQINLEIGDEVGMLLESFNSMTSQLRQNRKELALSQEELVQTNRTLQERSIFVELVLQNIHAGIFLVDNSGFVKAINPFMIEHSKLKQRQILGKHYKSILSKDELAAFEDLNERLQQTGASYLKDEAHVSINKKPLHIAMELYQLQSHDSQPLGRLLVVTDLTETNRSTRARAWREVARRIAHEIKNPLTPIQLSAQRLRRKYLEQLDQPKTLDECTATIINEVNHLKTMVNEFSNFARLPEVNPVPANINQVLAEVSQLYKSGMRPGLQLELLPDPQVPLAMLDQEQMKRVFKNLIDNAIAAMEQGGVIRITTEYLARLKTIQVQVIDQGHGIPREMLHRIFDPYVTTKKDGTGLGLAIVQQIIQDHGGFIRLENREEPDVTGTCCTIELPAHSIRP